MKKERIDNLLIEFGFADSPDKAKALVMSGVVLVSDRRVEKPSEIFPINSEIRIKGDSAESRYVGRGGLKLERALSHFEINVNEFVCLDVGASTGGFTDCLLQNGAEKVYAVDAGTNQIDWKLRTDKRVEARENVNARFLKPDDFADKFDLIVMDVSFISAAKILPALVPLLTRDGRIIVLIKPQFEVGKAEVEAGGIVRDAAKHRRVVAEINSFAELCGLENSGVIDSPISGANGNKEFLALYERREIAPEQEQKIVETKTKPENSKPEKLVEGTDYYFENGLMVLTAHFLKKRGYCCNNNCRHCPYPKDE